MNWAMFDSEVTIFNSEQQKFEIMTVLLMKMILG